MNYLLRRKLVRFLRVIQNKHDVRYLRFNESVKNNGILLVIHESQPLGASLLALHIAEELVKKGETVYIVTRQFGPLNKDYERIAPLQVAFTKHTYRKICEKLRLKGFSRALLITAAVGDFTKITKDTGFQVVSMIHELGPVIESLHLRNETSEMVVNSDITVFSTSVAKNEVLKIISLNDSQKIFIKPQGIYYKMPSKELIDESRKSLLSNVKINKAKHIVCGVGNTTKRKGFDIFLKTAQLLPECVFIWAGKKEIFYDSVIKETNVPDNFVYLGSLKSDELAGVYALSDAYLMCSRYDTLPSTIFESLIFKKPVIGSTTSGGIVDVVDESRGYLTKNANEIEFANAIKYVLENIEKYGNIDCDNSFENYVTYITTFWDKGGAL